MLIIRTQELNGKKWTYAKAKSAIVDREIGHRRWWHYKPLQTVTTEARELLEKGSFPIQGHLVLKSKKPGKYLLMREITIEDFKEDIEQGFAYFDIKFGDWLYLDPDKFRKVVKKSSFNWHKLGKGRQLIYKADNDYIRSLRKQPLILGRRARRLWTEKIEYLLW
ncbi:MAG: hypothetical protein ACYCPW_12905 [Nitrososphaerales archaeon]